MIVKHSQLMVQIQVQQSQMQLNQVQQMLLRHQSQRERVVGLVVLEKHLACVM